MNEFDKLKGKIKNVIFDFGGVLLELYPDRTFIELSKVLGIEINLDKLTKEQIKILDNYEMGLLNDETFIWNLQRWATLEPQPRAIIDAWNAMLGGWTASKLELLRKSRDHFTTYLLSNTNAIHIDWVRRDLLKKHNVTDFDNTFFKKAYYSHLLKKRKPNLNIFEFVISDSGVDPKQTLFIDDNYSNVKAAREAGLHSIHHERNASLNYIFDLI